MLSLVEMKKYEYLDKEKLKGFDNYKVSPFFNHSTLS